MIKFLQGTSTELDNQSLTDTIAFETDSKYLRINGVTVNTAYADVAAEATHCSTADSCSYSNNADKASSANFADYATNADYAFCDYEKNVISSTYVKYSELLNRIYPVGSIYISMSETNPKELFGGEWQSISETFLFAASDPSSDTHAYVAGDTGGSNDAVVVDHTHSFVGTGGDWANIQQWGLFRAGSTQYANPSLNHGSYSSSDGYVSIGRAGKDGSGRNMPKYFVVYMWQRIE